MLVQIIVDYSFLYYKYKFQLDSGKIRRLTYPIPWHGVIVEKDISQAYYSIKEIEGFRKKLESLGHNVFVSVCFDMPSGRYKKYPDSEIAKKYKANRVKHLSDEDHEMIQLVEKILGEAGYNTYRFIDHESDDIIAYLLENYSQAFDYNLIYTPDLDLIAHVGDIVGVQRYKTFKGYNGVDKNNFQVYLEGELKCQMPYNALILYKATVGDKSDCIDGIKKFGPKAFDKLVTYLTEHGIDWTKMGDYDQVANILHQLIESGYFTSEQGGQALDSLDWVKPYEEWEGIEVPQPIKHSTRELREQAYMQLGMKSLID